MRLYHKSKFGSIFHGDSLEFLEKQDSRSADLIVTSPPFGLVRKKEYGNVDSDE